MDVLTLIKGDKVAAQQELREVAGRVSKSVERGLAFIKMESSHKAIFFPIMDGLGIPYKDADVNGVCIGDSHDKVEDAVARI